MTEKSKDIPFLVNVPLLDPKHTDLNQVSLDIKSSLERQIWKITDVRPMMSKEEAIEFAKKYLEDRRADNTTIPAKLLVALGLYKSNAVAVQERIERAWDIAVEYAVLDIIPYLYGEALD